VGHLRHSSTIIETLVETAGLAVVGAELDLTTGQVDFLDAA
jgi:hypothetical protein